MAATYAVYFASILTLWSIARQYRSTTPAVTSTSSTPAALPPDYYDWR